MKVGNKLLRKLGYVPYAEVENMRDAWKTARDQVDHDSKLCADLVIECQNQSKIVDDLTTENEKLRQTIDNLRNALAEIRIRIDDEL